ncbi:hypothetical protein IWW38_001620 [Coemansia aciculifera]|uniref:Uncharacterized protein n=1 Tax=Coemansia aciculifera TaxID=417176 RepID=A0ACC1M5T4_9FUNG|nr:hypothetical protein IWW38_001620 [Coemansia aciculifera]
MLLLAAVTTAESHGLSVRAVSSADISTFRGATLVKNGQPTSCEFGLIDNQSAFLAANCLDFVNGQVNQATKYEIYFDQAKGQPPGRATLINDKIQVHSLYNPTSFANNIAVVQFNFPDQGSWINYISVDSLEWTSLVNVRRQLLNPSTNSWGAPIVQTQSANNPSSCFTASALFTSNVRDMVCSVLSLSSPVSSKCTAPYGTLYGVSKKSMAVSALYSHSVVYANDLCSGGNTFHYFTMLSNYTRFASAVLGRQVYEYIENQSLYDTMWHSTGHHFQNANAMNAPGTSQFGGDIYALERNMPSTTNNGNNGNGGGNNSSGGDGGDVGDATSINNTSDGFVLQPIQTSSLTSVPTGVVTLVDPADNSSQSNVVIVSNSDSNIDFSDDGGGTGGNGTGGSGNRPGHDGHDNNNSNSNSSSAPSSKATNSSQGPLLGGMGDKTTGMAKNTVIALAVAIPIICVLLGVGLYFAYRNYKKRKADNEFKPGSNRQLNNMRVIMEEIGGASEDLNFPGPNSKPEKPTVYQFSHPLEVDSLNLNHN